MNKAELIAAVAAQTGETKKVLKQQLTLLLTQLWNH